MTTILVVDDNLMDRRVAASLLEEQGWDTLFAENGDVALQRILKQEPDLILSDLQMPVMDGLQLVEQVTQKYPALPVVIMTGKGSEEIAVKALQKGALSYVPKNVLSTSLVSTIADVLRIARGQKRRQAVLRSITQVETQFELAVGDTNVDALVAYLLEGLELMDICHESDRIRVGTALHEAVVNAREHGNLELDSTLREQGDDTYHKLARQRCEMSPFCYRRVHVHAHLTRERAVFEIRDEGPGFDTSAMPDPTDPENLGKVSGRGLFLIHTFMDEVDFNEHGNVIRLVKRKASRVMQEN